MFYPLKDSKKLSCKKNHEYHFEWFLSFIINCYYLFFIIFTAFNYFKRSFSCMYFSFYLILFFSYDFQVSLEYHGIWWLFLPVVIYVLRKQFIKNIYTEVEKHFQFEGSICFIATSATDLLIPALLKWWIVSWKVYGSKSSINLKVKCCACNCCYDTTVKIFCALFLVLKD